MHRPPFSSYCCSRGVCYSAQLPSMHLCCSPPPGISFPTCIPPFPFGAAPLLALSPPPLLVLSSYLLFRLASGCPRFFCCPLVAVHPLATRPLAGTPSFLPSSTYSMLRCPSIVAAALPVVFPHPCWSSSCILCPGARTLGCHLFFLGHSSLKDLLGLRALFRCCGVSSRRPSVSCALRYPRHGPWGRDPDGVSSSPLLSSDFWYPSFRLPPPSSSHSFANAALIHASPLSLRLP